MKSSKRVLAIDFDGVIHDHKHPIVGRRMGTPIVGTKEALKKLHHSYKLIIFTIWKPQSYQTIKDFMKYYELPYDEITNIKPDAMAYIDDKGIRFLDWEQVMKQL